MSNVYEQAMSTFADYKRQAGNPAYVCCFGKTFIERDSSEYAASQEIGRLLVEDGFGVIHGGYSGVMEAVSKGADNAISDRSDRNEYYNIGVPFTVIKDELPLSAKVNLPEVDNVLDRAQVLIDSSDAVVVMPSGGVGTLVELLDVFHQNQLNQKFGGQIKPIVCVGGKWQLIIDFLLDNLDMNKQSSGSEFIFHVSTPEEAVAVIKDYIA
jgi:predicted Rossmann-fold nucleotide-binding protein